MLDLTRRAATAHVATSIFVALASAACDGRPTQVVADDRGIVVSDTITPSPSASLAGHMLAVTPALFAYTSAPSGSFPGAERAIVRNRRTFIEAHAAIVEGGFDPVGVSALAGDTLETSIRSNGTTSVVALNVVPARRRPRVVRTIPARNKKDVPLNSRISVVFSEPVGPVFGTAPLRLLRGATPVAGRVEALDASGLSLEFVPDAPLAPSATYRLVVEPIQDQDGDAVEEIGPIEFTTGTSNGPATALVILPEPLHAVTNEWDLADIEAVLSDGSGEMRNVMAVWSSSDPSLVSVAVRPTGDGRSVARLQGKGRSGTAVITASAGGRSVSTKITLSQVAFSRVGVGGNGLVCLLTPSDEAYCKGNGQLAELGGAYWSQVPVRVSDTVKFAHVTVGTWHGCGLAANGAAYCWGYNAYGAAGGPPGTLRVHRPTRVGAGIYRQLSAGIMHTCAIEISGATACWGAQFGAPGGIAPYPLIRYVPTVVPGGHAFAQISAGEAHTCGITAAGAAFCWGANGNGQLGNGTLESSASPVAVQGGRTFSAISAGPSSTCAVTTDGAVYCWGEEGAGSGYEPLLTASTIPRRVQLPDGVELRSISVGNGPTCGVTTDDEAYCWGFVWDGDAVETGAPPTKVPGNLSFVSVSSGRSSCGVTREPAVHCWSLVVGPPYIGPVVKLEGQP